MFRTRKRPDEEESLQVDQGNKAPEDLLAKEAQMAEKLLEDLVPEEPTMNKEQEEAKPVAESQEKQEEKGEVKEEAVEKPKEEGEAKTEEVKDDQLSAIVEKVHELGVVLVKTRAEIRKAKEGYAAKTKEMEELQNKLKEAMSQIS